MTWLKILTSVLTAIITKYVDSKLQPAMFDPDNATEKVAEKGEEKGTKKGKKGTEVVPFCTDAEADALADECENALAKVPKGAVLAGHAGGLIAHINDLVAALRSKDWVKIQALVVDLLSHL